jgi:S1-C subfamily serine protease
VARHRRGLALVVAAARLSANSPGDAAGLASGDLLLSARVGEAAPVELQAPSRWLQLERDTPPGSKLRVRFDRAGREGEVELALTARVRHEARHALARLREESKAGIVLRTATAVEAAPAGLGAGGGAVLVGMARGSPWRSVGLRFGDVLAKLDGRAVDSPQVVLDVLRNTERAHVDVVFARQGRLQQVRAPLTTRATEVHEVGIPLLFTYGKDRGTSTTSALLGIVPRESTPRWPGACGCSGCSRSAAATPTG